MVPHKSLKLSAQRNFIADEAALDRLYTKLERNFEIFAGYFNVIDLKLKEPIHLVGNEIEPVDMMFGSYNVAAHLDDDFYNNKVAFLTVLNFPYLQSVGKDSTRNELVT
jgi:hypothetical protein